jgi:hypothetical protein
MYSRAITEILNALELNPDRLWARMLLSWGYILEGEYDQGVAELGRSLSQLSDESADVLEQSYLESGF